jgi:hypothetical protein
MSFGEVGAFLAAIATVGFIAFEIWYFTVDRKRKPRDR